MRTKQLRADLFSGCTTALWLCAFFLALLSSSAIAQPGIPSGISGSTPPPAPRSPGATTLTPGVSPPQASATFPATVTIEGAVRQPGVYPLQRDMRVRELLRLAGGLTRRLEQVQGTLIRRLPDGTSRPLSFNLFAAMRGLSSDDLPLQAGDRVIIRTQTAETPTGSANVAEFPSAEEGRRQPEIVEGRLQPEVAELSPVERLLAGLLPEAEQPLRQFGYELFRQLPTTFAPITDVPVSARYVIGTGDELDIVLWGGVQEVYRADVDRNGAITLPRLGVVHVSGLTLEQLQAFLRQRFAEFYPNFQMAVTLGQLRSILVYVVGEVQLPGAYTVSSLSTMINALFASGGATKNGSLRRIRLVRQGQTVQTLDLYHLLLRGDKSQDQALQSGDTIFVPVIGATVGITGNVKRPAIYEIEPGAPLRFVLEAAGGVTPSGYLQRVHMERFVANERKEVVDLDLSTALPPTAAPEWQTPLHDGDLVRVLPVTDLLENAVQLEGHVKRPGNYELKPAMRLRDLLPAYADLLPEPYLAYAEIVRRRHPDGQISVVPFNLGALLRGDASQNLVLQGQDIVRVFAQSDYADPPQVRVSGLVHQPGIYPLTEGMRVRDLVMRAGNVRNFAYLDQAELSRRQLHSVNEISMRLDISLAKALEGDPEHNLLLQNFDYLLVRQVPGVELRPEPPESTTVAQQQETTRPKRLGNLPADIAQQRVETVPEDKQALPVYPAIPGDVFAAAALERASRFVEHSVSLLGEVRFPGTYPVYRGEHLSSVLQRAGGYTDNAYLRGAVFTRQSVQEAQEQRFRELLRQEEQALFTESASAASAALSQEEVAAERQALESRRQLLERLRTVRPEGRVVIRLQALDAFAGSAQDIELEPGDQLVIPQDLRYVNILGQVYNPLALLYEPGRDLGYYLEKVGGVTPEANRKEIHLVQVDGTVISKTQDQFLVTQVDGRTTYIGDFYAVQPQPGDTIVVPRRLRTTATLRNTRDIVQIIFQSISTLGIIVALL